MLPSFRHTEIGYGVQMLFETLNDRLLSIKLNAPALFVNEGFADSP